jgi:hypothetical protein
LWRHLFEQEQCHPREQRATTGGAAASPALGEYLHVADCHTGANHLRTSDGAIFDLPWRTLQLPSF